MRNQVGARLLVVAASGVLCACSASPAGTHGGGSSAPATATPLPVGTPLGESVTPSYPHYDMSKPVRVIEDCVPSTASLGYFLGRAGSTAGVGGERVAAVVVVTGSGAPRWNTADGQRPTQAAMDALQHPVKVDGHWPVPPSIYTPYTVRIERVLRGHLDTQSLTAYLEGGSIGQDSVQACTPTFVHTENAQAPGTGHTYLMFLWRELTHEATGADPVVQPVIGDLDVYDPGSDVVQTLNGPTKLADAMKGLPPG